MLTALWFERQETCNSITHSVMKMPRALGRINSFSYVSLNCSTHTIYSFTKRVFYFQPLTVMAVHPIKLHPGLTECTTHVQVLHITSGILSINIPGTAPWQLDTDTCSNAMLPVSAAWDHPFVCREGTSAGPGAALYRDTRTTSQLQAVQVHYRRAAAQADQFCREVGCWGQGKPAAKMAAFLQELLQEGSRLVQVCLYVWCITLREQA